MAAPGAEEPARGARSLARALRSRPGRGWGFLDGELRRGVGFQPFRRDRHAAADRAAVAAVVEPLQRAIQYGQPVPQALRDGVVLALGGQRLCHVGAVARLRRVVLGLPVLLGCPFGVPEQAFHLGALGQQPRLRLLVVHDPQP